MQFIDNFVLEKNTWRMIGRLYHDRLATSSTVDAMDTDADADADTASVVFKMSEKKMVERLFKRESFLRQAQAVVDWLEQVTRRFVTSLCFVTSLVLCRQFVLALITTLS